MNDSSNIRNPEVVHYRMVDGQLLVLHVETGAYHVLNPLAAEIWDLLDSHGDAADIATELRSRLQDPPDDLDEVVADFLADLRERDLIT